MRSATRPATHRDKRVTIQKLKAAATTLNHNEVNRRDDDNWETVAIYWCGVTPKGTNEAQLGNQIVAAATTEFEFRYDAVTAAITPEYRLQYASENYQIEPAINVEARNDTVKITGVKLT